MMFIRIWKQLTDKDSRLNDPETKVEFTSANLRKLLEQVYEQGRKSAPKRNELNGLFSSFSDLFGK